MLGQRFDVRYLGARKAEACSPIRLCYLQMSLIVAGDGESGAWDTSWSVGGERERINYGSTAVEASLTAR